MSRGHVPAVHLWPELLGHLLLCLPDRDLSPPAAPLLSFLTAKGRGHLFRGAQTLRLHECQGPWNVCPTCLLPGSRSRHLSSPNCTFPGLTMVFVWNQCFSLLWAFESSQEGTLSKVSGKLASSSACPLPPRPLTV